jgi:hypothetical protein
VDNDIAISLSEKPGDRHKKPASRGGWFHLVKMSHPRHPVNGGKNSCRTGYDIFHGLIMAWSPNAVQHAASHKKTQTQNLFTHRLNIGKINLLS